MNSYLVKIDGMMCEHCASNIEKALKSLDNVDEVLVSLEKKQATIVAKRIVSRDEVKSVIEESGYHLIDFI
jgi:copper chaperone CopZ